MPKLAELQTSQTSLKDAVDCLGVTTKAAVEDAVELGRNPTGEQLVGSGVGDGGAWTDVVRRGDLRKELQAATQAMADTSAQEARKVNLRLSMFPALVAETDEKLLQRIQTEVLQKKMGLEGIMVTSASRLRPSYARETARGVAAAKPLAVLLKFATGADRQAVLRARVRLAGSAWGLDEDLTPAQQQLKTARWPDFRAAKEAGKKGVFFKGATLFINYKPTGVPA
jgi:hypothetical protein